ncbi:MAG: putative sulfate exporter family transporter [Rikenellaceae bacterium]
MFKKLLTEDWLSTMAGLVIMIVAISMFVIGGDMSAMPSLPKTLSSTADWANFSLILGALLVITYIAMVLMQRTTRYLFISLTIIVLLAVAANYLSSHPVIKSATGLEIVFFAVALGLLISNTIGVPEWMRSAIHSEFFVKIGLVLMGTTIIFSEIVTAGALGMIQALIVILSVWGFAFWTARRLKVDREMSVMLASAVSICGVSAAIAAAGAIKGDNKKLSYVISLVLVCAIPMMYFMPYLVQWMGLSPEVAGAWLGGTIDTTGAVVAAGSAVGEVGEKYSVIVKSSQNVLLGFAALFISIYWTYKGKKRREKVTLGVLWERFPKFVLGFLVASLIFSLMDVDTAKSISKSTKSIQNTLFAIAFVCIGLETRFKDIFNNKFRNALKAFLIAQFFNIIVTLVVSFILFSGLLF